MEKWFNENKDNPYASKQTLNELAQQTKLTCQQVSTWLNHARNKSKYSSASSISIDQKIILKNSFMKNSRPAKDEIQNLARLTNLAENRIAKWFTYTRYRVRISNGI
jgi:hypothetical protein